jgi:hypothetical protein
VKKAFAWIAGLVGIAALGRWLARRSHAPRAPFAPASPAADPADELRRRLDESRGADVSSTQADERSLEERRAEVHLKAQEAVDAMRESGL